MANIGSLDIALITKLHENDKFDFSGWKNLKELRIYESFDN